MSKKLVQIGMDDIDNPEGGCTTHFASIIVEKLSNLTVDWVDYPNLIRLNPGIPYRTRGNGAVALRFRTDHKNIELIIAMIQELVQHYVGREYPNTNPGVVFLEGNVTKRALDLSKLALWRVVPVELALRVIEDGNLRYYSSGNQRGLIGAISAIANTLTEDHTYEYIAYRTLDDCSETREVDAESVRTMDRTMGDRVFSNVDEAEDRILIEPHGSDPVLFGVRGETANSVIEAGMQVLSKQKVDRWMVFRSNQGTGEHLKHCIEIKNLRPYMAAVVTGRIDSKPRMVEGGHSIFSIVDSSGKIDCAAYEPSGEFRESVMKLMKGDSIKIHAGVRPASRTHELTLNLEGFELIELAKAIKFSNPICPECGKRLKSAGSGKGFKCAKCGYKNPAIGKTETHLTRNLDIGLYLPPARAQRHLTRPLVRVGRCNKGVPQYLIEKWHHY